MTTLKLNNIKKDSLIYKIAEAKLRFNNNYNCIYLGKKVSIVK